MKQRVIYYSDPVNDDFAGTQINTADIGADFPFINRNILFRIVSFILYYFVAFPLLTIFCFALGFRVKNRKALRKAGKTGYFLYGNHTHYFDAFYHSLIAFPKRSYVIANRDAVSIPGLRTIVMMLGALPIPPGMEGMKKFTQAVEERWRHGHAIAIFPEAHIWPYYNKVRPFPATSFRYPVKLNSPVFAIVTVYKERKIFKFLPPRPVIHVSEPFHPRTDLACQEAKLELRNRVHAWMEEKIAEAGSVEYIRYEYRPKE